MQRAALATRFKDAKKQKQKSFHSQRPHDLVVLRVCVCVWLNVSQLIDARVCVCVSTTTTTATIATTTLACATCNMWSWQRLRHKPLCALISLTVLLLALDKSAANTETPPAAPPVEATTTTEPGELSGLSCIWHSLFDLQLPVLLLLLLQLLLLDSAHKKLWHAEACSRGSSREGGAGAGKLYCPLSY